MAFPPRPELDALVSQAQADDPSFRERLLADPRSTLSALIATEIPEFVRVTVHEECLTHVHLVVPTGVDEIREEDLELVADGNVCWLDCNE